MRLPLQRGNRKNDVIGSIFEKRLSDYSDQKVIFNVDNKIEPKIQIRKFFSINV